MNGGGSLFIKMFANAKCLCTSGMNEAETIHR